MAVGDIKPGYMGVAEIDGQKVRCTDFNINTSQEPLFYDHTIGLRDSVTSDILGSKGDDGSLNQQKIIWRPSVKSHQGTVSYPLTSRNDTPLYQLAKTGEEFDIDFDYACGIGRTITGCRVNSYTFTVSAGDIVNISADIMALKIEDSSSSMNYAVAEKIVTWDDLSISGSGVPDEGISGFTFTINNNCTPIYTAGANDTQDLNPGKIRVGMQMVTGVLTVYNKGTNLEYLEDSASAKSINVSMTDGDDIDLNVLLKPIERSGTISPVVSSISFVGVDYALGS